MASEDVLDRVLHLEAHVSAENAALVWTDVAMPLIRDLATELRSLRNAHLTLAAAAKVVVDLDGDYCACEGGYECVCCACKRLIDAAMAQEGER